MTPEQLEEFILEIISADEKERERILKDTRAWARRIDSAIKDHKKRIEEFEAEQEDGKLREDIIMANDETLGAMLEKIVEFNYKQRVAKAKVLQDPNSERFGVPTDYSGIKVPQSFTLFFA